MQRWNPREQFVDTWTFLGYYQDELISCCSLLHHKIHYLCLSSTMSAFPSWDFKLLFIRCLFPVQQYELTNESSAAPVSEPGRRISFCCGKAGKPPGIRKTLFTFSRGDELDYRISSFLFIQQNCQILWKMVEMGTVFSFRNWKSTFWPPSPEKKGIGA